MRIRCCGLWNKIIKMSSAFLQKKCGSVMQDNSVKKAPEEDFATHQCGPLMRGKSKRLCRIYIGNDYLFWSWQCI